MASRIEASGFNGLNNGETRAEIRERLPRDLEVELSENEKKLLKGLEGIVDEVEGLWQAQKRTPFYYKDLKGLSDEEIKEFEAEIRELGRQNPKVVSPNTYVEKQNGQIITTPYYQKFPDQTTHVSQRIHNLIDSFPINDHEIMWQFYSRLQALADAFTNDNWENADRERFDRDWVNKVEFVIGPTETHLDELGIKTSYQGVVGVVDEKATSRLGSLARAALTLVKDKELPRMWLKAIHVTAAAGITNPSTREPWKAQILPNDPKLAKEFGARGLIYMNLLEDHFDRLLYPLMRRIFETGLLMKHTKQELFMAYVSWIGLHEFEHPETREIGQDERQGSLFTPFHELHCDIAGLSRAWRLTEHHFLKTDQFEEILMVHLARKLNDIFNYHFSDKKFPTPYAKGSAAEFNYLVKHAGLGPVKGSGKLGLDQEEQIITAINNLVGKFNIDAQSADLEETAEFFSRYTSHQDYMFLEPLARDLFEEPEPHLSTAKN